MNYVVPIAVETEHARAFGVSRDLEVQLEVVARIFRAVAVVEDIHADAVLEAHVGAETNHRQRTEVPAFLDDFAFLVVDFLFLGFLFFLWF